VDPLTRQTLHRAMTRLSRGDRSACDEVFVLTWPLVKRFCASWNVGDAAAEDLAQQVLVRVFEQATSFDSTKDALTWVLEVATWSCRTERRRTQRSKEDAWTASAEGAASPARAPDEEAERRQLLTALDDTLAQLPEASRREVQKVLLEQAAGSPAERKRRQRALQTLKDFWRRAHGAD
jgi:RNA polymerase sigma factor (sigma-70 family)